MYNLLCTTYTCTCTCICCTCTYMYTCMYLITAQLYNYMYNTLLYLQVKFVMSDETSLADLLALNLHNFEEEVNTCTFTCLSTDSNSCMYSHM